MKDIKEKILVGDYGDIFLTYTIGGKYLGKIEGFWSSF